jgi:hypothetical protein
MKETHYTPNVGNVPVSGGVVTIPASQIAQGNTTEFVLTFNSVASGCALVVGNIARIRVLAGNVAFFDVGLAAYQAWMQRFSPRRSPVLATGKILPIPFHLMDEKGQKRRKVCQVPPNMPISIQLYLGAFVAGIAEAVNLLVVQDPNVAPQYSPLLIGNGMGIAAGLQNRPYDPKMEGLLRAIIINTVGLLGFSFTAGGRQLYDQISGDALYGEELISQAADGVTGAGADPVCVKQPMVNMNEQNALVKLTTEVGVWGGIGNELTLYLLQPEGKESAEAAASGALAG